LTFREFSSQHNDSPGARQTQDAPQGFRAELVDVLFTVGRVARLEEQHIYESIGRSLGVNVPGNPMSSRTSRAANVVAQADWPRVFDLVLRFVPEFSSGGAFGAYREAVNRLLAGYGIAWDLDEHGKLVRVLPPEAAGLVHQAVAELSDARFAPASALLASAREAYDDRPRRDRDACTNAFDSMESVAKEKHGRPHDTFGQVVRHVRQAGGQNADVLSVLEAVNTLRNHHFGHGMTAPFALTAAQVDFTYLTCVAGILLFVRTP